MANYVNFTSESIFKAKFKINSLQMIDWAQYFLSVKLKRTANKPHRKRVSTDMVLLHFPIDMGDFEEFCRVSSCLLIM